MFSVGPRAVQRAYPGTSEGRNRTVEGGRQPGICLEALPRRAIKNADGHQGLPGRRDARDLLRRETGVQGTINIGGVVIEEQHPVRRRAHLAGDVVERLAVRLEKADLEREEAGIEQPDQRPPHEVIVPMERIGIGKTSHRDPGLTSVTKSSAPANGPDGHVRNSSRKAAGEIDNPQSSTTPRAKASSEQAPLSKLRTHGQLSQRLQSSSSLEMLESSRIDGTPRDCSRTPPRSNSTNSMESFIGNLRSARSEMGLTVVWPGGG